MIRKSKNEELKYNDMRRRVLNKEEAIERKSDALEKKENSLKNKEEKLAEAQTKVDELSEKRVQELERISGLTSEQAKEYLLKTVEEEVKIETAKLVKELEAQAKEEADKKAKEIVVTCYPEMCY
ncbi:MAG: Rnase Y domain-containing protein [Eubacterium ventriosum]